MSSADFVTLVEEFEDWTELLLLDALQRSGFFTAGSNALSLAELQSRVPATYMRFMAEATDLLRASGEFLVNHILPFMKGVTFLYPGGLLQWSGHFIHLQCEGSGVPVVAGYIKSSSNGRLAQSAQACTRDCLEALTTLQHTGERLMLGPGANIITNIKLVSVCMQALPKILAGVSRHHLKPTSQRFMSVMQLCKCSCASPLRETPSYTTSRIRGS